MDSENTKSVPSESKIALFSENIALNEMAEAEKADCNLKNVSETGESWQDRCEYYKGRLASANNLLRQVQISVVKPAMEYDKLNSLYKKTSEQLDTCINNTIRQKQSLYGEIEKLKQMQKENLKEQSVEKRKRRMERNDYIENIAQLEIERDAMTKNYKDLNLEYLDLESEHDRLLVKYQKLQVALSKLKQKQSVSDSNSSEVNSVNRELTQSEEIRIEDIVGYEGLQEYCEVEMEKYNDTVVENNIAFVDSGLPTQELDVIDLTQDHTSPNKSALLTDSWANEDDDDMDSIIVDEGLDLTSIKQNLRNSMSSLKSDRTRSESIDNPRKKMSIWRNKEIKNENEIEIVSNTEDVRLRLKTVTEELNNTKDNLQTTKKDLNKTQHNLHLIMKELNNTKATLALKELKLTFCEKKAADKTRDCDRLRKELKSIRKYLNKNRVMKETVTTLTRMVNTAYTKYSRLEKRENMRHKNIQFQNTILKKKRLESRKRIAEQRLIKEGDSVKRFKKDGTDIIPSFEWQALMEGQEGEFSHDRNQKQVAREPEEVLIEEGDSVKSFNKDATEIIPSLEWQVLMEGQESKFSHDGNLEEQVPREPEEGLLEEGDSVKSFNEDATEIIPSLEWQVFMEGQERKFSHDGNQEEQVPLELEERLLEEGDSVKSLKEDATEIIPSLEWQLLMEGQEGEFSHDGNQEEQVPLELEERLLEEGDSVKSLKEDATDINPSFEWQVLMKGQEGEFSQDSNQEEQVACDPEEGLLDEGDSVKSVEKDATETIPPLELQVVTEDQEGLSSHDGKINQEAVHELCE